MLNSNNVLTYDHEELIKEAMNFYPDALWRVVVMHYSIYSRKEEDNFYRPLFSKMFDKYDIDLVLSGHDHIYTLSALMRGNEKVKSGGTLYLEANTASGCNYDGQPDKTPWYAASHSDICLAELLRGQDFDKSSAKRHERNIRLL